MAVLEVAIYFEALNVLDSMLHRGLHAEKLSLLLQLCERDRHYDLYREMIAVLLAHGADVHQTNSQVSMLVFFIVMDKC